MSKSFTSLATLTKAENATAEPHTSAFGDRRVLVQSEDSIKSLFCLMSDLADEGSGLINVKSKNVKIKRLYEHLRALGWVVDPFTFSLHFSIEGLRVYISNDMALIAAMTAMRDREDQMLRF